MKNIFFVILLTFVVPCLTYAQEIDDDTKIVSSNIPDIESERKHAAIKIFMKSGKFIPSYKNYIKNNPEYQNGFNQGMSFVTSPISIQGTDIILKDKLKQVSKKSREYEVGFFAALESYFAISSYIYYEKLEKEKANE